MDLALFSKKNRQVANIYFARHNGPALSLLEVCKKTLPKATNVAFFDSTFHASMPDFVKTYPIDQKIAKEKSLRKYGFHGDYPQVKHTRGHQHTKISLGISYQWILRHTAKHLGKVIYNHIQV